MSNGLPGKSPRFVYGQMPLRVLSLGGDRSLWLTELDSMQSHLLVQRVPEGREFPPQICYADREGNIWIGTIYNGLYRVRRQSITTYAEPQGLITPEVYPVFEDRDGTIWVGGDRLYRLKDGVFTTYSNAPIDNISSIYQDRAGQLWINGRWRIEGDRIVSGLTNNILSESGNVWTMYQDREGAYWFGTDTGVVRYQNGAVTRYTTKDGLAGNDTKVIIEDSTGELWMGSYGGLTHFKDERFTAWTERDGLPGNTVRSLYQDRDGLLWIGTYDGGLGRFKDGRFTRYSMSDGLYSNGVFQILEDSAGWCWMSSNRGIYRVLKQELNDFADGKIKAITSTAYGKPDGMLNAECNGGRWPAGIRAHDGKLWFPTMEGVAVIDPATITTNTQPPPVVIEGLKINNQAVDVKPEFPIRMTPKDENFEIQYTALSFINSESLRFKYKLEGLDHDWIEAGTRRTAYFSHVPPGEYTFTVIAANSDGVWNNVGKSMKLIVLPPFYRTWWFLVLGAVALILTVWLLFRYRIRQLRARNEQQQRFARQLLTSQEDERKRIALELHDSLGQNLLIIKNQALLNAVSTTDEQYRTHFNEFSDAVSQSLEEVRTISHNLRPPHLDQLGLRTAVIAMIEKIANSSKIEFVSAIGELDGIFSPADEILLYRIVQECLNNILKHSGASQAEIRLTSDNKHVTLDIHDNGTGFTSNGDMPGPAGLGLQSIVERARILGGIPTIHSKPGQGTTVTLRIERKNKEVARTI
jgi:signal transduction histidine kinase